MIEWLLAVGLLLAAPTVGWRGDGTSRYPDASPPIPWSRGEHVQWETAMPGWSNASPVVVGDRVCTLSEPSTVLCAHADTGAILWQATLDVVDALPPERAGPLRTRLKAAEGAETELRETQRTASGVGKALRSGKDVKDEYDRLIARMAELRTLLDETAPYRPRAGDADIGWTSPTPVTDGTHLWVLLSTGVAACFTLDGTKVWSRWLGPLEVDLAGYDGVPTSSPRLAGGHLILPYNELLAVEPLTGDKAWSAGGYNAYGTPAVMPLGTRELILTPDGRVVDAADGRVMAQGLGDLWYSGPVFQGDVAYWIGTTSDEATGATWPTRGVAWRLAPTADAVTATKLWETQLPVRHRFYATPLVDEDRIVTISRHRHLVVLDRTSGTLIADRLMDAPVPSEAWQSPLRVGDQWLVTYDWGHMLHLDRTTLEVTATSRLERGLGAPFFRDGKVWVRGREHLFGVW